MMRQGQKARQAKQKQDHPNDLATQSEREKTSKLKLLSQMDQDWVAK